MGFCFESCGCDCQACFVNKPHGDAGHTILDRQDLPSYLGHEVVIARSNCNIVIGFVWLLMRYMLHVEVAVFFPVPYCHRQLDSTAADVMNV